MRRKRPVASGVASPTVPSLNGQSTLDESKSNTWSISSILSYFPTKIILTFIAMLFGLSLISHVIDSMFLSNSPTVPTAPTAPTTSTTSSGGSKSSSNSSPAALKVVSDVSKPSIASNWDFPYRPRYVSNTSNPPESYDLVLRYVSRLFGARAESSYIRPDAGLHTCNITDHKTNQLHINKRVFLTSDESFDPYASGFIFHGPDVSGSPLSLRAKKTSFEREDLYIYHTMESPGATSISLRDESIMSNYNLLMSYHFHSDVFLPYIGRGTLRLLVDRPLRVPFGLKNEAPLAWIGSNCGAHNGRQDYLRELFKYVKTDSFGACLKSRRENIGRGDAMMETIAKYKFYIVMENSNCLDYITEKLGSAIAATVVPVVFAIDNVPNYDHYMPEHSYINAADFESAKALGEYLTYVARNETEYNAYLSYKFESAKSEIAKENEWQKLLKRYEGKETRWHWCRAAEQVYNQMKYDVKKKVRADNSCYRAGVMKEFIDKAGTE